MTSPIRVLIVDDSAFMRTAIARLLGSDARFSVAGQARDGNEAVKLAAQIPAAWTGKIEVRPIIDFGAGSS